MVIAFDFETYRIDQAHPYPKPVCLSSFNGWQKKLLVGFQDMEEHLQFILSTRSVAHNATFECGVIYHWFPALIQPLKRALGEGRLFCTHILQSVLNAQLERPLKKLSLDALVRHYFNEDISATKTDPNSWRLRYAELDGVPKEQWPEEAIHYSLMDSVWTHKLYHQLELQPLNTQRATEASFYLNMIGKTGICIDQNKVNTLESEVLNTLLPKYAFLVERGFCTPTKRHIPKKNTNVLRAYIKEHVSDPLVTAKGNIKVDAEALAVYYDQYPSDIIKTFQEIAEYEKVLTAFISRLKGAEQILTDYSTTKSTARTSSFTSQLYPSVNIQQMPRKVPNVTYDVRNCFVPREGFKMVSIDYSGLELASAATQLKKCFYRSKMLDLLNSGDVPMDLHSFFAAKVMSLKINRDVSYEEFLAHKKEEPYAQLRQLCKAMNLGFPGGIGYDSMRKICLKGGIRIKYGILAKSKHKHKLLSAYYKLRQTEPNIRVAQLAKSQYALVYDELVGLKQTMFTVYPELGEFLTNYHQRATTGIIKRVKNDFEEWEDEPMYRYTVSDFHRNWCTYTAYCNGFLMQTPAAIGATQAAIMLGRQFLDHPDVNVLAFIHDEFLLEIRDIGDNVGKYSEQVSEIMIDEMQNVLKGVRIAVERSVMNFWSKSGGDDQVYWKNAEGGQLEWSH